MSNHLLKLFWVGEETELFSGESIEHVFSTFFSWDELVEIKEESSFGEIPPEKIMTIYEEDRKTLFYKGTARGLANQTAIPQQVCSQY